MTCGQAARLHPVDWRTRMAERLMAQCDGGFITRRQQPLLNCRHNHKCGLTHKVRSPRV